MPDETNQVKEISVMTNKTASHMLYHELKANSVVNTNPLNFKFVVFKVMDDVTLPVLDKSESFAVVRVFPSFEEVKRYVNSHYTSDLEWVEYNWSFDNPMTAKGRAFDAEFKVFRL